MSDGKNLPEVQDVISFQRLAYFLICLCIAVYALYIGSSFFIPITFGIFFALILKPVCDRFEANLQHRVLAVFLTLLTAGLLVGGIIFFFVLQVQDILTEAEDIQSGLEETFDEVIVYLGGMLGLDARQASAYFEDSIGDTLNEPFGILSSGLSTSGLLLVNFSLVMIYTFFFLLYRTAVKHYMLSQLPESAQQEGMETLREVQQVAKKYLGGMGIVMLILGVLNSIGLYFIGIDFPLVWGFLGAALAVIPYVGTVIGGLLPFLYAIATVDTFWQPIAVVALYSSVQFIEGNLITPKVVGNSVKINALAAVMSLIVGSLIWGLPGIVLAIPLLAIVRIILDHIEPLRPLALLLSDDLYDESYRFGTDFNAPRYRLSNIFGGKLVQKIIPRRRLTKAPLKRVGQTDPEIVADPETD